MKLWRITVPSSVIPFLSRMFEADATDHSLVDLVNYDEFLANWDRVDRDLKDHEPWEREVMRFRTDPPHVLRIDEPSFALDYFSIRTNYASARLRAAFALGPDEIAYRPIDASQCKGAARAMDYDAFLPLKVANPFDPARMPGHVRPVRQEDGSLRDEWVLDDPPFEPGIPTTRPIYFRPGFTPPAPLFRAMGMRGLTVATEELAHRVSRAGLTGIAFQELEGERAASEAIYRNPD